MCLFYQYMQGKGWESIIDKDTLSIIEHDKEIGKFFHKSFCDFKPDILMTGSRKNEFFTAVSPGFLKRFTEICLRK